MDRLLPTSPSYVPNASGEINSDEEHGSATAPVQTRQLPAQRRTHSFQRKSYIGSDTLPALLESEDPTGQQEVGSLSSSNASPSRSDLGFAGNGDPSVMKSCSGGENLHRGSASSQWTMPNGYLGVYLKTTQV